MELAGKAAVVTGASSGIGRAVALRLAQAGMAVTVNGRRAERIQALADTLGGVAVVGDLNEPEVRASLLERPVDVLVNNAGVMIAGAAEHLDDDQLSSMVRTNVEATFLMAHAAVRAFKAQGHGHLVNISSVLGTKIRPTAQAYAGTKHALEALAEGLRIELAGTGVKVTNIRPGLVMTELHEAFPVHPRESLGVARPLLPEDVAETVFWALTQPEHVLIANLTVLPADHAI